MTLKQLLLIISFNLTTLLATPAQYIADLDRENLHHLTASDRKTINQAIEHKSGMNLIDLSIKCQNAGLIDLANQLGHLAINQINSLGPLLLMAQEFMDAALPNLKSQAVKKAIDVFQNNDNASQQSYQFTSYHAMQAVIKLDEFHSSGQILTQFLNESPDQYELFEIYKLLKNVNQQKASYSIFIQLLKIVEQDTGDNYWLPYIANYCVDNDYSSESWYAIELCIKKSYLLGAIKLAKKFGFQDLLLQAEDKFIEQFTQYPSLDILNKCEALIEIGEYDCALHLCKLAFEHQLQNISNIHSFFKISQLIYNKIDNSAHKNQIIQDGLQRAVQLCTPGELAVFMNFGGQAINFYSSSDCLLMLSKMSQHYNQDFIAHQAADNAVTCALAYPYYDTPKDLLSALNILKTKLRILNFTNLENKVNYYRSEIENPSIIQNPSIHPKLFGIYWVQLNNTKGAEIKKTRPCIIMSGPNHYTKGDIVTVIPISTKKNQKLMSVPFDLNGEYREARLDQVRSVDTVRLLGYAGQLPLLYQSQLRLVRLAHKNIYP